MARMSAWAASNPASVNVFQASPVKKALLSQLSIEVRCASLRTGNRQKIWRHVVDKNQPTQQRAPPKFKTPSPALDICAHHQKKEMCLGSSTRKSQQNPEWLRWRKKTNGNYPVGGSTNNQECEPEPCSLMRLSLEKWKVNHITENISTNMSTLANLWTMHFWIRAGTAWPGYWWRGSHEKTSTKTLF